jgi:glutamate carboxypeptidase
MTGGDLAADVRLSLQPRRREMVDLLGRLVQIESPSDDPAGLARFASELSSLFEPFGSIETVDADASSAERRVSRRHLRVTVAGGDGNEAHAVVLCHYDTVWPKGTLDRIPFSVDADGVARGPGCFDMKGGIVILYFALQALRERGLRPRRRLDVLFTCDEEIGSPTSRALIEHTARGAELAYVLESPLPSGTLKTARKGTGDYLIRISGRAAHAGVEPEKGISAIGELAHQVLALHALTDYALGTTVNVGVARGGTRPNVVAAEAEAHIDVRVQTLAEAERIDAAIRGLQPKLPGAVLDIDGGLNRPPMERSGPIARLFEHARQVAKAMDVDLREGSTGGGSDGNFTAAMGVPTLDGLGAEGEGAHAAHEHVLTESFPRRVALLTGLLIDC